MTDPNYPESIFNFKKMMDRGVNVVNIASLRSHSIIEISSGSIVETLGYQMVYLIIFQEEQKIELGDGKNRL